MKLIPEELVYLRFIKGIEQSLTYLINLVKTDNHLYINKVVYPRLKISEDKDVDVDLEKGEITIKGVSGKSNDK